MSSIDDIIERTFPAELVEVGFFEDWCEENIIETINPMALNVIPEIEEVLTHEKKELEAREKIERACWTLIGEKYPIKSVRSIRSKLARDIRDEEKNGSRFTTRLTIEEVETRIYGLSDLSRVRIKCTFHHDARHLSKVLLVGNCFLNKYECPNGMKDFIYDEKRRDGLKGHRAHQFSARIPVKGDITFGFEVQLMTLLQNAWDRRNHPIYEYIRENRELSTELKINDFACSEALHVVDQQADRNWEQFLRETNNGE